MTSETDVTEEFLAHQERAIREGLGPEEGLLDVFKDGEAMQAFLRTGAGRVLVHSCVVEAVRALRTLTDDVQLPNAETENRALLALRMNIGILRRMSVIVREGMMAEQAMIAIDHENDANDPLAGYRGT